MVQEIIHGIRSLQGDTLGDMFKNFSFFISANNEAITSHIEEILFSFIPQNNLEKLLRLNLIDKFQRTSQLISIFEKEDIFYNTRALNCKWFFTDVEVNSAALVNEILPNLSYSIRYKFIKKCSKSLKDTGKAEEIYGKIQQRYGINCALVILPACGKTFIRDTLYSCITHIKPMTMKPLLKLYPDIIVDFFSFVLENKSLEKRRYSNFNFDKCSHVFAQLASKYPERFLDMFVKHSRHFPYLKLGNRTTKRLIKINGAIIIKHWEKFQIILGVKQIKRYMNASQIEEIQLSYFPKTLTGFFRLGWQFEQMSVITMHLGEDIRQGILMRNFKKVYGKDFNVEEFTNVIDLYLILLLPVDMRIKWIQEQLPTLDSDNKKSEYLSYLPPHIALPALKQMITKQKEYMIRAHMVKCMLISTKRYNEASSLVECISFVLQRLRNDSIRIRENVFNELDYMKLILRNLSLEEWKAIDELVNLCRMNDETGIYQYFYRNIASIKMEKHFSEKVSIIESLQNYLDIVGADDYYCYDLCNGTPYRKECLEFFLTTFPTLIFKEDEVRGRSLCRLFSALCNYNRFHKNNPLEFPEWMLDSIEKWLVNPEYKNKSSLMDEISKLPQLKERIYLKVFPHHIEQHMVRFILRKKPLLIKEHEDTVMKAILNYSHTIQEYISTFKEITLYTSFNLPRSVIDLCLMVIQLQTDDAETAGYKYSSKSNAISVLSIIMSANDFIEIVTPYKPTKKELEEFSNENHLHYRIQRAIAKSLKYVNTPSEVLSYIKSFAVGDYLKSVVGSINSICLKVAEKKILPLLIEWMDCPVSLRKHFIRAYYKVAPVVDTANLIVTLLTEEKNLSLRLLLLEYIYKYFLTEPSEESFAVFKAGYSQIKSEDVAAVDNLFDLKHVPDLFLAEFVKMLWEAVELKAGPLVHSNKTKVIKMIDAEILSLLPEEFCDVLLKHVFSCDPLTELSTLITLYLIYASDELSQMYRLEKVLQYLKEVIDKNWNSFYFYRNSVFQTRDNVSEIIEKICAQSISNEKLNVKPLNLLEKLKSFLLSVVPSTDLLDVIFRLEITIFIHANKIFTGEDFLHKLAIFYENQLTTNCPEYGDQIIETIVSVIPDYLDKYKLQLAKILLCEHSSYQANLMAIRLVDTDINKDVDIYKIIVEFLLKCNNPYLKAAAGSFLKNLSSNVEIC